MKNYNVICFVTDQQRADHLGCYGNPDVKTPNIDQLATDGVRFLNSFITNPVCSPNRACMFTGQYPKVHGLRENGNALSADSITLPKVLKENNYETFSSGKLHLAPFGIPLTKDIPTHWKTESLDLWNQDKSLLRPPYHGIDSLYYVGGHGSYNFGHYKNQLEQSHPETWKGYLRKNAKEDSNIKEEVWCSDIPEELHYNTLIADKTIEFLRERNTSKPFFAWCSFPDPHHPFSPPEPWYSMYKSDNIQVTPIPEESLDGLPDILKECNSNLAVNNNCLPEMIAKNYGMISMVDHNIGRVVNELEKQDILEDTIIVFFSDHGDYMGDHGLMRKAIMPYDGVYKVPTIWRIPGKKKTIGTTSALHSTVDIMPTILELTGVNIPDTVQGVSQAKVLFGEERNARDVVYAEYDETVSSQRLRYIRDDSTMFAYFYGCDYGLLYDMKNDPDQQTNLFYKEEYQQLKNEMIEKLARETVKADSWKPQKVCHA